MKYESRCDKFIPLAAIPLVVAHTTLIMDSDLDLDASGGYDLPLFLEDKTGLTTGTVFTDLYDRLKIKYVCLSDVNDSMGTTYGIYNLNCSRAGPDITLEFGADNSLGTIKLGNDSDAVAMDDYLPRVSSSARCILFVLGLLISCLS